jgi:hypothetical protein
LINEFEKSAGLGFTEPRAFSFLIEFVASDDLLSTQFEICQGRNRYMTPFLFGRAVAMPERIVEVKCTLVVRAQVMI